MTGTPSTFTNAASGTWRLDPTRTSVAFQVRTVWGLMRVKGSFDHFRGSLRLRSEPRAELVVDAASLRTGIARRDKHLRSTDFFDVEKHPELRFVSDEPVIGSGVLKLRGELHAAGRPVRLEVLAQVRDADGELEIDAETTVDQRRLGMKTCPFGMTRAPATISIRGILTPDSSPVPTGG